MNTVNWRALYKQGERSFDPWPELDYFYETKYPRPWMYATGQKEA